jgi:hypothetical protein
MSQISEIKQDIRDSEIELLGLYRLELESLFGLVKLLKTDDWNKLNLHLDITKSEAEEYQIRQFDFKSCLDEKVKDGIKQLLLIGFERAIKKRKTFLESYEELLK